MDDFRKALSWTAFKNELSSRGKTDLLQYEELTNPDRYYIWFPDGELKVWYQMLFTDTADKSNFETVYKATANKSLNPTAAGTNAPLMKPKPVDGTIHVPFVYFTTGVDEIDQPDAPDNIWDIDVSVSGVTDVIFKPAYSYYVDGGGIHCLAVIPANEVKLSFIFSPNPPQGYPGNIIAVSNKKICTDREDYWLEAPPKYMKYYGTGFEAFNQIMVRLLHNPNDNIDFEFRLRTFR